MLTSLVGVFLGGGIGSVLRWLVCTRVYNHWGTMLVNVVGAFLIGCAYVYFENKLSANSEFKLFIMTGLLGGFTTFSTYLLNFSALLSNNNFVEGFSYLLLSIIIGCAALVTGMKIASVIL